MMSTERTISRYQMEMLSDIFRLIAKEIVTDEDKDNLAPGEIGISYAEGTFYVKNPYTGELFTPNSVEHLNQVLSKFDDKDGLFNADRINGIRFYSNVSQLSDLGISLSADSIIRQMEYPSILMSSIDHVNYSTLGYPCQTGVIIVYKMTPTTVVATFKDTDTSTMYDGIYNTETLYLDGWAISGGRVECEFITSIGGGDTFDIQTTDEMKDLDVVMVRTSGTINAGATVKINGKTAIPVLDSKGSSLSYSIAPNNIIMLIYDAIRDSAVLVGSTESAVYETLKVVKNRTDSLQSQLTVAVRDYNQKITEVNSAIKAVYTYVNEQNTLPGVMDVRTSTYTASIDGTDTISGVTDFTFGVDKLVINFGQTILRPGIDYSFGSDGSISFINIKLLAGDILQFIVIKQTPAVRTANL